MTGRRPPSDAAQSLGATWDGQGVRFALFSENATAVELCLFDDRGGETRIAVPVRIANVWQVYVAGAKPGQRYGWRVDGPYAPREGHRFNRNKLLLDPYARALDGAVDLRGPVYAYPRDRGLEDLAFDDRDDVAAAPRAVVVDPSFDWAGDNQPRVPWADTILYEVHVRGFTKRHPLVPEAHRGTFLGLASEAAISHLLSLGVTTLEVLPVHEHVDEFGVASRGMTNYWGYSTLAFFAPERRFTTPGGDPAREFKEMVKRLHAAGIEVILDVVYNHTCEGDELGPTLSFRGIDNRVYYRLHPDDPRRYVDYSGCGNTLNAPHPQVTKLIADSLRYWVTEMHVDGFRFDLAPAIARVTAGPFDRVAAFLSVVHQDPVLSRVKLIAEPWDLGVGGYQVGNFPVLWTEWNGRYRDTVRGFWRGESRAVGDLGYRLTGSSDLFRDGRGPDASINFITTHDGFTLRDLVSYERKHNLANGEDNRDGLDHNTSQNCGVEGETRDPVILANRKTIAQSLVSTLFLSQGVPMLEMGDELWKTQLGNNNPYCQDSELTWMDWRIGDEERAMLDLVRSLGRFRRRHSALRRTAFFRGTPGPGGRRDIVWLRPDGQEMNAEDWAAPAEAVLAFRLDGDGTATTEPGGGGASSGDASLLVFMNGEKEPVSFSLPGPALGETWRIAIDTRHVPRIGHVVPAGGVVILDAGSLIACVEDDGKASPK